MIEKLTAPLYRTSDHYQLAAEAMAHLRKQFLRMPFEEFVNAKALRHTFSENAELSKYLSQMNHYLDFGTDSYRYFMRYLEDAKTAEVAYAASGHDIHTDMWGRIGNQRAYEALRFAMGFTCFSDKLNVEELGLENDYGYAEETVSVGSEDVKIFGHKNANGNFHGFCQILQGNDTVQRCFFNDGRILARRIEYANGMCEDGKDNDSLLADPYAPGTVYELCEPSDGEPVVFAGEETAVRKVAADRETVKMLFDTLGNHSLCLEYRHYVSYPYCDEDVLEIERTKRTPTVNMAMIGGGRLLGVLFKTNGRSIRFPDSALCSSGRWDTLTVGLGQESVFKHYTVSLRKKDENGDLEK